MTIYKTIALAVTGSRTTKDELSTIVSTLRQQWHCDVVYNEKNLLQWQPPEQRAHCLIDLMQDPAVDLIWIARGGEGSCDVVPYLHQQSQTIQACVPKPVLGLSDATSVLIYLHQHHQWQTTYVIGAAVLARASQYDAESIQKLQRFIVHGSDTVSIDALKPLNAAALEVHSITAPVCVGNMSLLAISIKDAWEFDAHGKILAIEDWYEKGYVVDRTIKYFKRIGKLDGIRALIFGDMTAGRFSDDEAQQQLQVQYMDQVLRRLAEQFTVPVLSTRYVGHGLYQTPLTMGVDATLECGISPRVVQSY